MTQQEKQLLLKDLCGRLPYHDLWVQYHNKDWLAIGYGHERIELLPSIFSSVTGPCPLIDEIKPYLRPMSSMTPDERFEYDELNHFYTKGLTFNVDEIDWLIAHHFDYRIDPSTGKTLIESGLALEAPEGMYK